MKALMETTLYVLFGIALVSCNDPQSQKAHYVIDVGNAVGTGKIENASEYIESIRYVALETTDSILVAEIEQVTYENEEIIVLDNKRNCLSFDREGNWKNRIGRRGAGPDEYQLIHSIDVFHDTKQLFMEAYPRKNFIYQTDGTLIGRMKSAELPDNNVVQSLLRISGDLYFADPVSYLNILYKGFLLRDENGQLEPIKAYPNYFRMEKEHSGYSLTFEAATLFHFKDEVRSFRTYNDTIFTIGTDQEMKMAFLFDFGKYKAPLEWIFEYAPHSTSPYIYPREGIMESERYLFIDLCFGDHAPEPFEYNRRTLSGVYRMMPDRNVYCLFDKTTGTVKLLNQPTKGKKGFRNDLDNGPVLWPQYISSNNELVRVYPAEDFLEMVEQLPNPSKELQKVAKNLQPDDNPVVIIAKLKK